MQSKRNTLVSFILLLFFWQTVAMLQGERIFFPSFLEVWKDSLLLFRERNFWETLTLTLFRVIAGVMLCFCFASLLSFFTFCRREVEIVWKAFFQICRILPSVVMILLLLIFFPIPWIPFCIQICVVLPLLYEQSLKALENMNPEYQEFLEYYDFSLWKKFSLVYFPIIKQEMYQNMESILGLCMKVTIAGELLSQEERAIGGEIFIEKMYLNIPRVLAWCLVLLCLHSILFFFLKRWGKHE